VSSTANASAARTDARGMRRQPRPISSSPAEARPSIQPSTPCHPILEG
jgi:hypothetical protein